MKNLKFTSMALGLAIVVCSCGTAQKNGTLIGAGGGAAVGAGVGYLIGKNTKGTLIGAAVGAAVGGVAGNLIGKHMDKVKAEAAAKLQNADVSTVKDANGLDAVKVTFDNGILFQVGKSNLQTAAQNELKKFAEVMKGNTDCAIAVQGFASSDGSDETNLKLSQNRADAVTKFLNSCGVTSNQIASSTGFGETNLIYDANGKEDVKASRRVEVYMYASPEMIEAAKAGTLQ